jgi:hypothetical protein
MNFKIKLDQSFRSVYRSKVYMHMFIEAGAHTCMSIYIYTVFVENEASTKLRWRGKNGRPHPKTGSGLNLCSNVCNFCKHYASEIQSQTLSNIKFAIPSILV